MSGTIIKKEPDEEDDRSSRNKGVAKMESAGCHLIKNERDKGALINNAPEDLSIKRRDKECQIKLCCDGGSNQAISLHIGEIKTTAATDCQTSESMAEAPASHDKRAGHGNKPSSTHDFNIAEHFHDILRNGSDPVGPDQLYCRFICHMLLKFAQSIKRDNPSLRSIWSLDDLLRPSFLPDGLIRNVSLHQQAAQPPHEAAASSYSAANFGFPQGAAANVNASGSHPAEQSGAEAAFGGFNGSDGNAMKDYMNTFGSRDFTEADNNVNHWPNSRGAAPEANGSFDSNGSNYVDIPSFDACSSSSSGASSSLAATASNGFFPPGYNPYLSRHYSPLVNHSYAAASVNNGAEGQHAHAPHHIQHQAQPQGAVDSAETDSHTSGKSTRSKDFSFDSGSVKQDPDEGCPSERVRQSRDERKARELGIPFSIHDIINLPMDEFNDMLSRHELNEEQLNLCRDIRRRGKNKVAAQNCRKRKIDQITQLEHQVQEVRARKMQLLEAREQLFRQREEWANILSSIEEELLVDLNRDPKEFSLDMSFPEGRIIHRVKGGRAKADSETRFPSLAPSSYNGRYLWKGNSPGSGSG